MSDPGGNGAVPKSSSPRSSSPRSYYGQPVIKEPVWTPEIPFYFFAGGLGGAAAGLAALAELRGNEELARRGWAVSLGALAASPALLISDLGKPSRFMNMLRLFKMTSPMSVGSWVLSGAGGATGIAAASSWLGLFPRAGVAAKASAALLGLPVSTYTAALVANTAVPVWREARMTLPFAFAGGAAASAGAALTALTPVGSAAPARRLAVAGAVAELTATEVMQRRLGDLGRPYREGRPAAFSKLSKALLATGATVIAARGRDRPAAVAGGVLIAAGALAARWSVFRAGFASAADPAYTVGPQRERIDAGTSRGAARSAARDVS
jgi:hypothetical protein